MDYALLGTLFFLYIGWMLKSWIESLEDSASDQPPRYAGLGGALASRVPPR